jgi:hypothetical protein
MSDWFDGYHHSKNHVQCMGKVIIDRYPLTPSKVPAKQRSKE